MDAAAPPSGREVRYVDLAAQFAEERDRLMPIVEAALASGQWVGGEAVEKLEAAVAATVGVEHCVAVNSGTDALILGLQALGVGPGHEVVTQPNSFVASAGAIARTGARPVFCDVLDDQNMDPARLEAAIGPHTRAIMPVHLTGRVCDMEAILAIAQARGIPVIEDAAQAFGSTLNGRQAGSFGALGCFSCHPLKNLNACGDGGLIVTRDGALAKRLRRLRNHGLQDRNTAVEFATVSRMDAVQAEILRFRLRERLADTIARRRANVALYRERLDPAHVFVPPCRPHEFNTFVLFVAQLDRRDALQRHLAAQGIGTAIHYPTPIHLLPAARALGHRAGDFPAAERQAGRILSLPHHPGITAAQVDRVAETINAFYRG